GRLPRLCPVGLSRTCPPVRASPRAPTERTVSQEVPMRPVRRDVLRVAGAAAVLGLGSACARIPVESPIDARALDGRAQPGAPYVRALPPASDATAQAVVAGCVRAGAGPGDDFAVAREYRAAPAREQWDPRAQVTIYSGSQELEVEVSDDGEATLVVRAVAM